MSSLIFRRRDFDPDEGDEIDYEDVPSGIPFKKTGQRRLYFTKLGLEYRQPVDDTNNNGAPDNGTVSGPIRIVDMGLGNTATGDRSAVVGGQNNHATANRSVVLGGDGITANVQDAAFAQRLHVLQYIQLPVYTNNAARDIAIPTPATGMLVFVGGVPQVYDGLVWKNIAFTP
jgi:hypothetical protein